MKNNLISLLIGIVIGVTPWILTPFVSDYFEPWDSEIAGAFMLFSFSIAGFLFGFIIGMKSVLIFTLGIYLISNIYPYVFGSSESRVWAVLGLITSLLFCVFPFISGLLGKLSKVIWMKFKTKGQTV